MLGGDVPVCPGIIPDASEEQLQRALAEAHEVLPPIPGTRVCVVHFPPIEGFERLRQIGYGDQAIETMRGLLAEQPDQRTARIVVCYREPVR